MKIRHAIYLLCVTALIVSVSIFVGSRSSSESPAPVLKGDVTETLKLEILAQVGPWPVASRLIGFKGRLWFANSVKGRNHISADIWSLDPASGGVRYERHLFSQDAGVPLIHQGLLYWPFEDALMSYGNGVVEVTDGERWEPLQIRNPLIYHTSELFEWQDRMFAITGSRYTALHRSADAGESWDEIYAHPTPSTHISRLKEATIFQGRLYATLSDTKVRRLTVWTGSGFENVKGWPSNRYLNGLVVHQGFLFGIIGRGAEREVWKFDGETAVRIGERGRFVDLASDEKRLWIVSRDGDLWSTPTGQVWSAHSRLEGGRPVTIEAIDGAIYVAGTGEDGRGIVWGPPDHTISTDGNLRELPSQILEPANNVDWALEGAELDQMLSDTQFLANRGARGLRPTIERAVRRGAPPGFWSDRLGAIKSSGTVTAFGGNLQLNARDVSLSLILMAMARSRHPEVPADLLMEPWTEPPNSFEKYVAPQLAALRAVALSGQNDRETIMALVSRLEFEDDPQWLQSLVIGVLTQVTGQQFGYDIGAWKHWSGAK